LQVEKEKVVNAIRQVAGPQRAEQADRLLPDPIDIDQYAGMLREFGVDPEDLVAQATTRVPGPLKGLLARFMPRGR